MGITVLPSNNGVIDKKNVCSSGDISPSLYLRLRNKGRNWGVCIAFFSMIKSAYNEDIQHVNKEKRNP